MCQRSTYDLDDRIISFIDNSAQLTRYSYDFEGNIGRVIDPLGRITEYDYSGGDRLSGRIDPSGAYTDWQYYVDFGSTPIVRIDPHLPTEDPALYTTTYDVDVDNGNFDRILRINLPSGGTVHFDYDSRGNRTAIRSDDGNGGSRTVWSATYGPNGEILTQTDRSGTTVNQYTAGITEPTRITDVFGVVTDASYNSRGQLASMITRSPWGNEVARLAYDNADREIRSEFSGGTFSAPVVQNKNYEGNPPDITSFGDDTRTWMNRAYTGSGRIASYAHPEGFRQAYRYDPMGRLITSTDQSGHVTRNGYNNAGELMTVTDETLLATTTFERDVDGRPTAVTDTYGARVETTYHPSGRATSVTDARDNTTTFAWTANTSSATDPLLRTTTVHTNEYGVPVRSVYADGSETSVEYVAGAMGIEDPEDFPASITDEMNRTRLYGYDVHGQESSASDLAGAVWDFSGWETLTETITSPTGVVLRVQRNEGGEPVRVEHPGGGISTLTYTNDGTVDLVTLPSGTSINYDYDTLRRETSRTVSTGESRTTSYDLIGRLASVSDVAGPNAGTSVAREYDTVDRFAGLVTTRPVGAGTDTSYVRYERDKLGRITHVGVKPSSTLLERVTTYSYDLAGNLTTITDPEGGITTTTYDVVNRPQTRTLPNGVVTSWTYDLRDRVLSIEHKKGTVVLARVVYVRNASGDPTRITREHGGYTLIDYEPDHAIRGQVQF